MKYAVIGKGKTGSHVIDLLKENNATYGVFDSKNRISLEALKNYDAGICFVNGPVFKTLIPVLIDSQIPLVIGTTGFQWDESLFMDVKKIKKSTEIYGGDKGTLRIYNTYLSDGRNFIEEDLHRSKKVCILGMDVVDKLFPFEDPILKLSKGGESIALEFKSSYRTNTQKPEKPPKVLQHSVVKTVAAFANTFGSVISEPP